MPKKVREPSGVRARSKVTVETTSKSDVLQQPVAVSPDPDSPFAKVRGSATVRMRTDEIIRLVRGVG